MTRFLLVIGAVVALIVVLISVRAIEARKHVSQPSTEKIVPVSAATVTRDTLSAMVEGTGTITGWHEATVMAEAAGKVVRVLAEPGQAIGAGGGIVELDREISGYNADQAEAQALVAKANATKAKADLARVQAVFDGKGASQAELDMAKLGAAQADAGAKSTDAVAHMARRAHADGLVSAPFAGVVANRFVDLGEHVKVGDRVAIVSDLHQLKLVVSVDEFSIALVHVGDVANVTIDALAGQTLGGKVTSVGAAPDPTSRRYPIEIAITPEKDSPIKSGMFGRARIVTAAKSGILVVPKVSVTMRGGQGYAYLIEGDHAVETTVTTGSQNGERIEITSGLKEGDQIVRTGHRDLANGSHIAVDLTRS